MTMSMKPVCLFCIVVVLLLGAAGRSDAGGGYGGWRGGGGWGGGGGVVIVTPAYYYPPYPYYYNPYYPGYPPAPAYYGGGPGAASVATAVQAELSRRGYYKGPIDGIVGAGTRTAISAYQRTHGLEISGTIDTPLLRSLGVW